MVDLESMQNPESYLGEIRTFGDMDLKEYDMIVFYNPSDVQSLFENFPAFEQGDIKFVSFGKSIVKAMEEKGLKIEVKAPTPEAPSVARAIELYLQEQE